MNADNSSALREKVDHLITVATNLVEGLGCGAIEPTPTKKTLRRTNPCQIDGRAIQRLVKRRIPMNSSRVWKTTGITEVEA